MGHFVEDGYGWPPYVPVAERRRKAECELQKLEKKGIPVSPVLIQGRAIARTFWGKAWCQNLESYSDYSNRLPRGRTYVRNGSVLDLQVAPGEVSARVSGSRLYKVSVKVAAVPTARWSSIRTDCAGAIDSLVELLQGRLSQGVMQRICQQKTGLFPAPAELQLSCSCPDWATMCKHVAAVLYGIGSRLDEQPELLFKLRKVDATDLISGASKGLPLSRKGPSAERLLAMDGLSELFGLEIGSLDEDVASLAATKKASEKRPSGRRRLAELSTRAPKAGKGRGTRAGGRTSSKK